METPPSLDDLIALARSSAASDDPIDELAAAATLKNDLDELTDALLGHFVDQARRAGRSWSQIGEALGVTKQAAQQKHTSVGATAKQLLARLLPGSGGAIGNLARFTDRAKAAVVAAQEAARDLGHPYIGTEHLLLGLYGDLDGLAAKVLLEHDIDRDRVEAAVLGVIGRGTGAPAGHIPFTPRAKQSLELAFQEALQLGHNYIGTEHQLLGLLREGNGVAAQVLLDAGLTLEAARGSVIRLLTTGG